ncbi:MinD/ParA family ATP-binding protein [Mycobacteroides abscessus]|uniref:MinD/ParA family ATP-binding protein n=2 Tax=Mycobacteroides abscessus TaxID=36809 RepID=UPI00092C3FDF|nr:MinD/ParA family protein [Mycobacteroides abscessus]SIA19633.1 ESX-1 secretion-associated protein EspI [Mycobacteroides abscessus subsp. abscessus]SKT83015.1 ESX-1 secretion-associated protein EspI [Mycobacteroides abscessus subsp. massiliense]SKT97632.1 ESX-1 secretion-associated protein EspI [Mycobacteroides abscessus subsp. massiliense]
MVDNQLDRHFSPDPAQESNNGAAPTAPASADSKPREWTAAIENGGRSHAATPPGQWATVGPVAAAAPTPHATPSSWTDPAPSAAAPPPAPAQPQYPPAQTVGQAQGFPPGAAPTNQYQPPAADQHRFYAPTSAAPSAEPVNPYELPYEAPGQATQMPHYEAPQQQYYSEQSATPTWMRAKPESNPYADHRVGDDPESLTFQADRLAQAQHKPMKIPPGHGWRKVIYLLTFKQWNLGPSPAEKAYAEDIAIIRTPVSDYKIGVISLKGGVGKTTTTAALGSTFAEHRKGDRVVALDANPDLGNLATKVPRQTNTTVKDLLQDKHIARYGDVRRHTSQNSHGLEVVASERDLTVSEQFSQAEYQGAIDILERHYNIIFTDCGTGLTNEAVSGMLENAHTLILLSSITIDGARAASATIDWLNNQGQQHLVKNSVLVLNSNKQEAGDANVEKLHKHFAPKVRVVHEIPFDKHLARGGEVDLKLLNKKARAAFLELAKIIATDFPTAEGRHKL